MMRAKMQVRSVEHPSDTPGQAHTQESITMSAVTGTDPFGPNGESEDNTYARFTPSGGVTLTITNPELLGKITPGDTFYIDFTKVE